MAAFSFFRRRQKIILLAMAVLMVTFLMPSLFQRFGSGGQTDDVVGHVDRKDVTIRMKRAAEVDLHLLRQSLGLGMGRRAGERAFKAFKEINQNQDRALAWTLLLHEARKMGIKVTKNQVDAFLVESGLTGEAYRRALANLQLSKYTEKHLHRAVADYLMVTTAFKAVEMNTMPSLPELRHTFSDLQERIGLATVAFEAEDFTAKAPDPSDDAVAKQFEQYKHLAPLGRSNDTDFGFGYRLPDRLEVAWLFLDEEILSRIVEPPSKQMMDYWTKHKGELKIQVPVPATSPATQPVEPEFREVVIEKYSDAKPQIRRILKDQAVEAGMNELVARARRVAERFADADKPYSATVEAMIRPADDLLSRRVASLPFKKAPVETIIEQLEELAKVKIVYPFGKHDKLSLDGKVVVSIRPWGEITLGEALKRVGKKAKFPPIKWVACDGLDEAIFPSEPVGLVPVSAGRTGLVGFEEIHRHELLGMASLASGGRPGSGGQSLLAIAATAEVFQPPGRRHEPLVRVGCEFDRAMRVFGLRRGRMLWRLVKAEASHMPQELTDEIRRQVVKDLKIEHGFKKALAAAEAMKAELEKSGGDLEKLAVKKKLEVEKTGMFSRKTMHPQAGIFWSYVPGVGRNEEFIKTAFTLVPSDPDGPHTDRPAAVAPLHRARKVMLIQRTGYEPVSAAMFDTWGVYAAGMVLSRQRWEQTAVVWFSQRSVAERVGYKPRSQ